MGFSLDGEYSVTQSPSGGLLLCLVVGRFRDLSRYEGRQTWIPQLAPKGTVPLFSTLPVFWGSLLEPIPGF